ncbi:MAG: 16S rRNA (guanine(966)-N(2))-methyltransferase RsmD [Propionibacteriaceae bacterium]|nr:16S rRNA (guanine(966)-N(2))-methyltransferase RsmD [Propionibacteriaceae bacterium]
MSRIIAGIAKGHRLATPSGSATRPTADRVREALFSALGSWFTADGADRALAGCSFLDLYAGSGAVGLEAASRGAEPVLAVEADRRTAELIRTNARTTGLAVSVRTGRVDQVLRAGPGNAQGFDVGWLDPPYDLAGTGLATALDLLVAGGWIVPAGLIVVERSTRSPAPIWPSGVERSWDRRYGETTLHFAELEEA